MLKRRWPGSTREEGHRAGSGRMAKRARTASAMTSSVSRDSINHPVQNSDGVTAKSPISMANVRKSKIELKMRNLAMNRPMKCMPQRRGRSTSSGSTLAPASSNSRDVRQEGVEQDLSGEEGQKGKEQRCARHADHIAEIGAHGREH